MKCRARTICIKDKYRPKIKGFRIDKERQRVLYSERQALIYNYPYDSEPYIPVSEVRDKPLSQKDTEKIEELLGNIRWARASVINIENIKEEVLPSGRTIEYANKIDDTFIAHRHGPYGIGSRHDGKWDEISDIILKESDKKDKLLNQP